MVEHIHTIKPGNGVMHEDEAAKGIGRPLPMQPSRPALRLRELDAQERNGKPV